MHSIQLCEHYSRNDSPSRFFLEPEVIEYFIYGLLYVMVRAVRVNGDSLGTETRLVNRTQIQLMISTSYARLAVYGMTIPGIYRVIDKFSPCHHFRPVI